MNITVSGINYKTTPLDIREKLSFTREEQKVVLEQVCKLSGKIGCVILSTCNRTEVYFHSEEESFNPVKIENILCSIKGFSAYTVKKYFYTYAGTKAVKHLFQVASGLDSMILGEDQILGQVKDAYHTALEAGTGSGVLNTLFRDAIAAAKKIKTKTGLSKHSVSIGSLAVKQIVQLWGKELGGKCALVIGAGNIGSLVYKNLCAQGIGKIYVTNRSHGKWEDMPVLHPQTRLISYDSRYGVMEECDIVISATASPHYTITKDRLESSISKHKDRIFMDLAVPRDLDISIGEVAGVRHYHMEDLQPVMEENLDKRMAEAVKAEEMLEECILEYEKWYTFRSVLPVVQDVQKYAERLADQKIGSTLGKLRGASEEDKKVVKLSILNTVNEMMDLFVYRVKEHGSKEDIETYFKCLKDIAKENE